MWFVLIVSGIFEAVRAIALDHSDGFSRLGPSLVFGVALAVSMGALARDAGTPRGTSYAVWVGIGASLTVVSSMATGLEPVSALKIAFLAMIIGGVIGLKVVH